MIYGIGIDIIRIDRMKEIVEKWGDRFLNRVFTKAEITYCYKKKNPYLSLAVRFAAKEALIKAVGYEIPISLTDIEVISTDNGKPFLKLKGKLDIYLKTSSINNAYLSMSHEREYGVACVVLEK